MEFPIETVLTESFLDKSSTLYKAQFKSGVPGAQLETLESSPTAEDCVTEHECVRLQKFRASEFITSFAVCSLI